MWEAENELLFNQHRISVLSEEMGHRNKRFEMELQYHEFNIIGIEI